MNLVRGAFPYFIVPFLISLLLVPLAKRIGWKLGLYAVENQRTVHHEGRMVRIGGVAIYLAFMLSLAILWEADSTLNGIMVGGSIVFLGGLIDDAVDLAPKKKLAFQCIGALAAMWIGQLYLQDFHILSLDISNRVITFLISFIWIIGITNAINLIDGLDGLSSGICSIVACTIGLLGFFMGRRDICILCLILVGSILGFLPYNFYPASIFMGDCGAQFMGFTLACISLLGFKTTALITLGMPILVLFIPISDTLIAIIRRRLKGQRFDQADRGHLHHVLMFKLKLGHKRTVLTLYAVTALFALAAILTFFRPKAGLVMILVLIFSFEIFVEYTGMINPRFHPLLSLCFRLTGHPRMLNGVDPADTHNREEAEKEKDPVQENR